MQKRLSIGDLKVNKTREGTIKVKQNRSGEY